MKPKKKKTLLARLTIFASPPKFTKGVRPKIWKKLTGLPLEAYPQDEVQREAIRPQLYSELGRIVRNLILAQDELAIYLTKYPDKKSDPSKARLCLIEHSLEMELIQLWGLLGRLSLRPLNPHRGVAWKHWRSFMREVRRDPSVLDCLEPAYSFSHHQEEVVAQ